MTLNRADEMINRRATLADEMTYWEGFGVQIEWFIAPIGVSAVGIVGDADNMQIITIDVDHDSEIRTQHTERVEFSTGGPEI